MISMLSWKASIFTVSLSSGRGIMMTWESSPPVLGVSGPVLTQSSTVLPAGTLGDGRRVLPDDITLLHRVAGLLMDHHIQAQNVFQLILRPAALLLLTVDQGHRRRALADNEGDGVALVEGLSGNGICGEDDPVIRLLVKLLPGLVLRLDHQLILLD